MASRRKVIITCAVTGSIHTPSMSPSLPVTPDEELRRPIDTAQEARAERLSTVTAPQAGLGLAAALPGGARAAGRRSGGRRRPSAPGRA